MTNVTTGSRLPQRLVCAVSGNLRNGCHLHRLVALNRARNPRHHPSPRHIYRQSSGHILICDKQVANLQIQQILRMDLCLREREHYVDDVRVGVGCRPVLKFLVHSRIVGGLNNTLR